MNERHDLRRRITAMALAAVSVATIATIAPPALGVAGPSAVARTCTIDVYSPHSIAGDHKLHDIDARSAKDIWAVGEDADLYRPLIYHWDGTRWKRINAATRPAGTVESAFFAVTARTASDAWAFGTLAANDGTNWDLQLLIQRWNGTKWRHVAAITFPGISYTWDLRVYGAVAIAADDAWVVGGAGLITGWENFALHWDGHTWARTTMPAGAVLTDIAGTSAGGVWASGANADADPTVYRWNGSTWVAAHVFDVEASMWSIDATKGGAVVASGRLGSGGGGHDAPFVVAGPKPSWVQRSVPRDDLDYQALNDIAIVKSDDIWAVGQSGRKLRDQRYPLIYRWNGTKWLHLKTPLDDQKGVMLEAVTNVPGTNQVYAAGRFDPVTGGNPDDILIARIC